MPVLPTDLVLPSQTAERHKGIFAFDRGWQFPAITEQHAYHRIRESGGAMPGTAYVAYPWATLIDKLDVQAPDAQAHLDSFRAFCIGLPKNRIKLTVCQHIKMPAFRHLFAEAGLSHVFWAHTTQADLAEQAQAATEPSGEAGLHLHPFPLYPVQTPQVDPAGLARTDRRWLYSFVGMRPNPWYLTQVRAWIIDQLGADPRGHVIARDDWHYKKIVYRHQVLDRASKDPEGNPEPGLIDADASAQFREVLYDSTFALCPSGTGPNSIRLWEAIMAGSIPVIISRGYAPPGDPRLWTEGVVFCDETPEAVAALPDRLEALARDPATLAALRAGMVRLRLLYGPHGFVPDVQALMQQIARPPVNAPSGIEPETEQSAARQLLTRASALLLGQFAPDGSVGPVRAALSAAHPVRRHYDRVVGETVSPPHAELQAPQVGAGTRPAVYLAGPGLTPLHYPALRQLAALRITLVAEPARADLIVGASLRDIQEAGTAQGPRLIISEAVMPEVGMLPGAGPVWLSHDTSDIFAFERLPYALVCDDHTLPRLAGMLSPDRDVSPAALCDLWTEAPARAVLWETVTNGDRPWPAAQPGGTELSLQGVVQAVAAAGSALRLEAGSGQDGGRSDEADCGLAQIDKLARLDGLAPVISAFETSCHPGHVGLSAIEAIALRALPAAVLGGKHRLREMLPDAAVIDLYGLTPAAMAGRMLSAPIDLEQAEAVCAARVALRDRLSRPAEVLAERQRIVAAVLREIFARA